ncbi:MAG: hypothetical protein KBT46_05855 [Ruminococcus sp.]|nr:hypothetical protein [Candidatus Copronaster equi]
MNRISLSEMYISVNKNKKEFIENSENLFDLRVSQVAEKIIDSSCNIVFLAGPSSSGKTTTAEKLSQKFNEHNIKAHRVSLDDFYINCVDIPLTSNGAKDFENFNSLDLDLLHSSFENLVKNREADLTVFDFKTGTRTENKNHIKLENEDVILVEGIHALNPLIYDGLDEERFCKIFLSVSTMVTDENDDIVFTGRNIRLIRRIIRDFNHRNSSVENTLRQWKEVVIGEEKFIFPFENLADYKIDSFHAFEPCMFKSRVVDLLNQVDNDSEMYSKSKELSACFEKLSFIDEKCLPESSLLMEFLG